MEERLATDAFTGKTSPEEKRLQHYAEVRQQQQLNATPYAEMATRFPQHAEQIGLMIAEIEPLLTLSVQLSVDVKCTTTHEAPKEGMLYTETLEMMTARLKRERSPRDMVSIIPQMMLEPLEKVGITPRNRAVFANLQVWQPLVFIADGTLDFSSSFPQQLFAVMDELTSLFMQFNQFKSNFVPSPPVDRPMPAGLSRCWAITNASVSPGFGGMVPHLDHMIEPTSPPYTMQSMQSMQSLEPLTPDSSPLADPSTSLSASSTSSSAPSTSSSASPPPPPPPPPPPHIVTHVSFVIIIHGQTLSGGRFEYPIEQELRHVSYAVGQYQCPATMRKFLLDSPGSTAIASDPRFSEHASVIQGFHSSNERCYSECDGDCWVALQPMLFSFESPEHEPPTIQAQGGIWTFYFMNDGTIQRNRCMGYDEMVQLHKLDRSYGTYMHVFSIVREKLRAIREIHTNPFTVNTLFHCCRVGHQLSVLPKLLVEVIRDDIAQAAAVPHMLYKYPTGAVVCTAVEACHRYPTLVVEMFAIQIATQPDNMMPLGHRPGGLYFTRQGCFYNMLVYLGIINHSEGDLMTSIQNRGITSRMFLNFMNKIRPINGHHTYMIEHLPITLIQHNIQLDVNNGLSKLLHTMIELSHHYQFTGLASAHAIIVKLYFPGGSEQGHWVTFTLDRNDIDAAAAGGRHWSQDRNDVVSLISATPWRYVDPQALSIQRDPATGVAQTVPMAFQRLNSLDEMCTLLNSFVGRYGAIDLFYIALTEEADQSFLRLDPAHLMNTTYLPHSGGKPRRHTMKNKKNKINKTKTKTKTKTKKTNTKRKCNQNKKKMQ